MNASQAEDELRGRARLLNHDECGQAICFGGGKGACRPRVACVPGQKPVVAQNENREQFTIHPIVDLNGTFGPWHLIVACETFTEGMLPDSFEDMPEGMVTHTTSGVQKVPTLLNFYHRQVSFPRQSFHVTTCTMHGQIIPNKMQPIYFCCLLVVLSK